MIRTLGLNESRWLVSNHHFFQVPSFQTPFGALIKTGVMMTGEMGFDDYFFQENVHPLPVTWVLFTLFVLIMVIILMNLLVRFLFKIIKHEVTCLAIYF